jgi:hypothetical protein
MAATMPLLKGLGEFWDLAFQKNLHQSHHFLSIFQIQFTIGSIPPMHKLVHYQVSSDIFYALMGHLKLME